MADNFDSVLDSVLDTVESTLSSNKDETKMKRIVTAISNLESKRKKLTDMLLDDKISKEAYDEKYEEFTSKITKAKEERVFLSANVSDQQNIGKRMKELRQRLTEVNVLDEFDRVVFESIVDKVIVGGVNEDGSIDTYKLTFVLKGNGNKGISDSKDRYINFYKKS